MRYVYLDHNSSSPLRKEVLRAVTEALQGPYGNPSSVHGPGHRAKVLLEAARESCAELIAARPQEIVFTSGGTEANNLAILGSLRDRKPGHVITSQIEHSSVLNPIAALEKEGVQVSRIPPDSDGWVNPEDILSALRPETVLISLMHSSNELGTLQSVQDLAEGIKGRGVLLHTDAAQSAGKIPIQVASLGADLVSISGHKFGGPAGTGFLWIREGVALSPLLLGGGQESRRRAGTEALPLIHGLAVASQVARKEGTDTSERIASLRDMLENEMTRRLKGLRFHGASRPRLPNTTNVAILGTRGEEMMMALDLEGFAVSTGSACSIGTIRPSHVLRAIGCSVQEAQATLRVSLGPENTQEEVVRFVEAVTRIHSRTRVQPMDTEPVRKEIPDQSSIPLFRGRS